MFDVTGIGSMAMDIIIQVDQLPTEDSFCVIKDKKYLPGGSAANVMTQLSRLNAKCSFIAKLGNDDTGEKFKRSLVMEKIDTSNLVIKDKGISLHTEIVVDSLGRKFIMLDMGDSFLSLESVDLPDDLYNRTKIVYTDLLPKTSIEVLRKAHEFKLKTVVNLQVGLSTMIGFGISKRDVLEALKYADVFIVNELHFLDLTGETEISKGIKIVRKYTEGLVIITRGKHGSIAFADSETGVETEAIPVQVVDTTGAGDSFTGSFIYKYLMCNDNITSSLHFASSCAALTCTGIGARSMPTLHDVEKLKL